MHNGTAPLYEIPEESGNARLRNPKEALYAARARLVRSLDRCYEAAEAAAHLAGALDPAGRSTVADAARRICEQLELLTHTALAIRGIDALPELVMQKRARRSARGIRKTRGVKVA